MTGISRSEHIADGYRSRALRVIAFTAKQSENPWPTVAIMAAFFESGSVLFGVIASAVGDLLAVAFWCFAALFGLIALFFGYVLLQPLELEHVLTFGADGVTLQTRRSTFWSNREVSCRHDEFAVQPLPDDPRRLDLLLAESVVPLFVQEPAHAPIVETAIREAATRFV